MDKFVRESLDNLSSINDKIRLNALQTILKITEEKVDWIYDVWDDLVTRLDHENSYQRSIAIMVLCNLAKSDSGKRLDGSLNRLLSHTRDEKFITSRQCIQNTWKLAATGSRNQVTVLDHLEKRFDECAGEKHYNLIRQDIIQSMRMLYDCEKDPGLLARANDLVATEQDDKYRKAYQALLKV